MNKFHPTLTAILLLSILFVQCKKNEPEPEPPFDTTYFPATNADWEMETPASLGWNEGAIDDLNEHLSSNGTRAFIILKDGKIIIEKYWGEELIGGGTFDVDSRWYWASASKTISGLLIGIAEEEGHLSLEDKTSTYLGEQWTNMSLDKENKIKIKHQLSMTTGLDYGVPDPDCSASSCLTYKADAGQQWFYHNAPYNLLNDVIQASTGSTTEEYSNEKIENKIGMNGSWVVVGEHKLYFGSARDAARFGYLMLHKGQWNNQSILTTENYHTMMTTASQNINPAYGYLTWINGTNSIVLPGLETSFNTSLSPNAPTDLYAALGKNGQYIDVIPSKGMVVIRLGDSPDNTLVPVQFHDDLWVKINAVIE